MPASDAATQVRIDGQVLRGVARALTILGWLVGLCGFLALTDTPGRVTVVPTALGLLGAALALTAPLVRRIPLRRVNGHRERDGDGRTELVVAAGSIRLGRALLRADEVAAAAVVREDPPLLAIARRPRRWAWLLTPDGEPASFLTFASGADLERARRALGIGPRGCGTLRLASLPVEGRRRARDKVQLVRTVLAAMLVALSFTDAAPLLLVLALWPALPVLLLVSGWLEGSPASVTLGPSGLEKRSFLRRQEVRYRQIEEIVETTAPASAEVTLEVRRHDGALPLRLDFAAGSPTLRTVRAALHAGAGTGRGATDPRWDALRRQMNGRDEAERASAWLARLDALATARGGPGYRESGLEPHALWSALEDPDADLDLRCAAARLLARGERRRLDETVAALAPSEPALRARVAVLLDPAAAPADVDRAFAAEDQPRDGGDQARLPPQRW